MKISCLQTHFQGHLTLQGWLCRWALMTLTEMPRTLEYLAYLGFNVHENESQSTAIQGKSSSMIIQ